MQLSKMQKSKIERLGKAAKTARDLHFELKAYLIDKLYLDEDFVLDNLNSILNDEMEADVFISAINEELEDK